jgi:hypothetical protein
MESSKSFFSSYHWVSKFSSKSSSISLESVEFELKSNLIGSLSDVV